MGYLEFKTNTNSQIISLVLEFMQKPIVNFLLFFHCNAAMLPLSMTSHVIHKP